MVERLAVYARVSPEHKIRIVQALKAHGHQVAMTGDGVNDAPAIKAADIGIAMGITGTDVAKETADVILLDDHFNTIVNAVEEGRGIYDNIRKFVNYLLSCNLAEVLIVLGGIVIFNKLPLIAVQLLFINMVTDGLPAVALGSDPAERGIMNRRPRHFQESIINRALWMEMAIYGCLMTATVLIPFWFNYHQAGLDRAVAVAFTATVVLELVRLINLRSDYRIGWLSNPWLIFAVLSSLGLQLAVVYIPSLSRFFAAAGVAGVDWLVMLVAATVMFGAMKLVKTALAHASVDKHKQLA
jgi:Ca2+-transporting ATPase